jgi:K+-transporting ATPase A subunit
MMDTQFKVVLLNEVKNSRHIIFNSLVIILVSVFLTYLVVGRTPQLISPDNKNMLRIIYQLLFILLSGFSMVGMVSFREYQKEKSDKLYETILSSPISLLKFVVCKLISLFL